VQQAQLHARSLLTALTLAFASAWLLAMPPGAEVLLSAEAASVAGPTVYWGAYVRNAPWNMADLDTFEAVAGKRVSILHFGYSWYQNGKSNAFPAGVMDQIRARGSIPMVNWGSWHLGDGTDQPEFRLSTIAAGAYDEFVTGWARSAKAWGHPFFLKFDHEMNGWWSFPWSVQLNGNRPQDYIDAWRRVHDIFEREGANNVTWVWCPNILSARATPLAQVYPGDEYVDWTCLHGYNFGGTNWRTFTEVYRGYPGNPYDSYAEILELAPSKPIMLGEWASAEAGDGGAAKAAWIRDALEVQIPNHFPGLRAVVWFNWNSEAGRTWLVDSTPASAQAFAEAIALPVYATNTFGDMTQNPIAALPGGGPYEDVPPTYWAHNAIHALSANGYIAGCSPGSPPPYCPEQPMTRSEAAVFVVRGVHQADFTPPDPAQSQFGDVPLDAWYAGWTQQLWSDGYTVGCGRDPLVFCPLVPHTRAEAAVFFLRMLNGTDYQPAQAARRLYADVPIAQGSPWFSNWVYAATTRGLVIGCEDDQNRGDSLFRPNEPITRAEAACVMARAVGLSALVQP
jgi:hypothetical protein